MVSIFEGFRNIKYIILCYLFQITIADNVLAAKVVNKAEENNTSSYFIGFFSYIWHWIYNIWNHTLFTMDNQPIAISNLVTGIILLILGLKLARYLSDIVYSKLIKIISLDQNVSHALGKISHYIFIIIVVVLVLDISHVPLTIFTFIGGALAVSIGIGGQHVINNFMSGLVVMIEHPVKVGDLIEVGEVIGRVKSINARCIDVRTQENKNIFIPHSIILQNNLINWTSDDSIVRIFTNLSITQGTIEPEKLEQLIIDILSACEDILPTPKPQVLLLSFENNIMKFEVNFWINLANVNDRRKIISDVNYLIEKELSKQNINMAVPYRKVIK